MRHDWSNSYVCVIVGRRLEKVTEGGWQRVLKVTVKEQFKLECLLSEQKNSFREFCQGQVVFVNLPTGFSLSSDCYRCSVVYFAI